MQQSTFIIGRNGNQPFTIVADSVSSTHARITTDSGEWTLEDLDSANGTFVRNDDGQFVRIYKTRISPDTVIRLGSGGHHSHTFMANRLFCNKDDYAYEFSYMKNWLKHQVEREEAQERKATRNGWISKCSGIIVIILTRIINMFIEIPLTITFPLVGIAPVLTGFLFKDDNKKLKKLRELRKYFLVCPKCGRPLSEHDIENMQCQVCKAK